MYQHLDLMIGTVKSTRPMMAAMATRFQSQLGNQASTCQLQVPHSRCCSFPRRTVSELIRVDALSWQMEAFRLHLQILNGPGEIRLILDKYGNVQVQSSARTAPFSPSAEAWQIREPVCTSRSTGSDHEFQAGKGLIQSAARFSTTLCPESKSAIDRDVRTWLALTNHSRQSDDSERTLEGNPTFPPLLCRLSQISFYFGSFA
jgi:hypothetical protein